MEVQNKLAILADAAKYDASCASSGGAKRDSRDGQGIGSTTGSGICHSYTPDGRFVCAGLFNGAVAVFATEGLRFLREAAALRAEGWHTVAALADGEDGAAQRCSHWLDGSEPRAY